MRSFSSSVSGSSSGQVRYEKASLPSGYVVAADSVVVLVVVVVVVEAVVVLVVVVGPVVDAAKSA